MSFLEYEAYQPMAVKRMREIVDEAVKRWPVVNVCAVHRVGLVPPGETSVLVAVATGHRAAAFEACRFLIDEIKKDVPIWKMGVFADGHRWAGPQEPGPTDG